MVPTAITTFTCTCIGFNFHNLFLTYFQTAPILFFVISMWTRWFSPYFIILQNNHNSKHFKSLLKLIFSIFEALKMLGNQEKCMHTSRNNKSSASSMWITCPILGRFCASGSTQRRATKRTRLSAFEAGISGSLGSTTSSDFRFPTIVFNQSTKFTCK